MRLSQHFCYFYSNMIKVLLRFNSLAPGRSGCNFEKVVFKLALLICIFKSYDNVARWIPQELTDNKSTLVQVMAWCHQATSHYLSQRWPRSMSPYGVTRPQWVKHEIAPHGLLQAHAWSSFKCQSSWSQYTRFNHALRKGIHQSHVLLTFQHVR